MNDKTKKLDMVERKLEKVPIFPHERDLHDSEDLRVTLIMKSSPSKSKMLNDGAKKCKFVNPNPIAIVASVLKDIISLCMKYKGKQALMFREVGNDKQFYKIEKQANSFRV